MDRRAGPGTIIAAILLPPLGIFLARGLGAEFWIGMVLTLVGWLPGVVFALFSIWRPNRIATAA